MMVPVFSQAHGPAYEYEQPSIRNIALHPLLRDPWEEDRCEVSLTLLDEMMGSKF